MAIDMLKRSLEILKNASVETGKNYFSNVSALKEDASIIKDNITKGVNTVADVYRKMKTGPGPLKSLSNWFYERGEQYGDFDDGDDEFDAGFDTDTGESQASAVLDTNSMRDIARGQVGAMYQIGGKQVEAAAANTAEIITTLNSRTSEITVSINNMNKTLLDISKRLEGISSVIVAKTEREQQQMPDSLVDYNGRLKLDQIAGRMWSKGIKESTPVQLGGMILPMLFQSGPTEAASLLMSMLLTGKEWNTKTDLGKRLFGDKASIDKIGERANKFIGDLTDTIVNGLLSSKPFQKMFPDIFTNRAMGGDYSSYRKNTYTAERAVFDGYTRTTIVDIIPAYLKEITKAVTGKSLGIDKTGRLTEKADNEFANAAVRGTFSATGMSYERSGQMYAQYKSTHGDSGFSASQYRAISKALVTAYTWQFFTGYEKSEHVTPVLLERYRKAATRQAIQIIRGSQGGNNVSEAQILEVIDLILAPVLVDRSWNPVAREFERDIQANLQRLHSQAVKAAQDYHTGKNAGRLKEREINNAAIRSLDEYGIFGGSDELSSEGATARQLDEKYIAQWQGKEQLTPEIKRKLEEAKRRIEDNAYQRKSGDKSSVSSSGRSLIEFNQHFEDLGVNILRKLHDVIQVKIVTKKPKEFYPDWMKGKAPVSGSETEKFGGGGEPTKPGSGTSTAGGTEDTRTTEQKLSDGVDAVIDGAKGAIARVQESVTGYIDSSDPNSLTNKVARLLSNDGKTADSISSKIGAAGSKIGGAISKVGTAVRTRGGSILQWARDEASNMWDDARNAAHGFLDKRLAQRENARQTENMRGAIAADETITDADKVLADTVLQMVQAATSTDDGKADAAAINDKIRQIKNQGLRQNLSSATKTMLEKSSQQEEQPAKSKLGKILKWALTGLGFIIKPILSAVKSVGSLILKGLKFVKRFFVGAIKQAGSALKDLGKDIGQKLKSLGRGISKVLEPIKTGIGKLATGIGKAIKSIGKAIIEPIKALGSTIVSGIGKAVKNIGDRLGMVGSSDDGKKRGALGNFAKGVKSTLFKIGDDQSSETRTIEKSIEKNTAAQLEYLDGTRHGAIQQAATDIITAMTQIDSEDDITKGATEAADTATDAAEDVTEGEGSPLGRLVGVALKILVSVGAFRELLNGLMESVKEAVTPIVELAAGLNDIIKPALKVVTEVLKAIFEPLKDVLKLVVDVVAPILKIVGDLLSKIVAQLMNVLTPILTGVANIIKVGVGIVAVGLGYVVEALGLIGTVVSSIFKVVSFGLVDHTNMWKAVSEFGKSLVNYGNQNFKEGISGIVASVSDLVDSFKSNPDESTTEKTQRRTLDTTPETMHGSAMDGLTGSGDVYNITYRNMYGSGNTSQYSYGTYMNMKERGCGPVALADAYSRRTGGKVSAAALAASMAGSGAYSVNRGTSVGGYMDASRALGMGITAGGVNARSLRSASPTNPITVVGSGAGYGTRAGNTHYMNVIGSDGRGVSYVSNPLTGRVGRVATGDIVNNSLLGLYGSGDTDDIMKKFALPKAVTNAFDILKTLASGFLSIFTGGSDADKQQEEADLEAKEQRLRQQLGSANYDALESEARARFEKENPRGSNQSAMSYENLWNSERRRLMVEIASEKLAEENKTNPSLTATLFDDIESDMENQYGKGFSALTTDFYDDTTREDINELISRRKAIEESQYSEALGYGGDGTTTGYDVEDLVRSVANIYDAYGKKDSSGTYSHGLTTIDVNGHKRGLRPDCSGIISASIQEMGYMIKGSENSYNGIRATNMTSPYFILDPSTESASTDWEYLPFSMSALQYGDIAANHEHVGMPIYNFGKETKGFDGGSDGGIRDSIKAARAYLSGDTDWKKYLHNTISSMYWNTPKQIIRFVGKPVATIPVGYLGPNASDQEIFSYLTSLGMSDAGAAGMMGVWKEESGMRSNNLQETPQKKFGYKADSEGDIAYTNDVNSGVISRDYFIRGVNPQTGQPWQPGADGGAVGYGLSQFTASALKELLYDKTVRSGLGIDNASAQIDAIAAAIQGKLPVSGWRYKQADYNNQYLWDILKNMSDPEKAAELFMTRFNAGTSYKSYAQAIRNGHYSERIKLASPYAKQFYDLYAGKKVSTQLGQLTGAGRDAALNSMMSSADGTLAKFIKQSNSGYQLIGTNAAGEALFRAYQHGGSYVGPAWDQMVKSHDAKIIKDGNVEYAVFDFADSAAGNAALKNIIDRSYRVGTSVKTAVNETLFNQLSKTLTGSPKLTMDQVFGYILDNGYNEYGQAYGDAYTKSDLHDMFQEGRVSTSGYTQDELRDWVESFGVYKAGGTGKRIGYSDIYNTIYGSGDAQYIPPVSSDISDYFTSDMMQTGNTTNNITVVRQDNTSREDQITALMNHTFEVKSTTIESLLKQILTEVQSRKNTQQTSTGRKSPADLFDNAHIPYQIERLTTG